MNLRCSKHKSNGAYPDLVLSAIQRQFHKRKVWLMLLRAIMIIGEKAHARTQTNRTTLMGYLSYAFF